MAALIDTIKGERIGSCRPWPRLIVTAAAWRDVAEACATGRVTLLGLWGDAGALPAVHMAVIDESTGEIAITSLLCPDGIFPSVGALHAPAIRLERAIASLAGLRPQGAPDPRPWLDLGFWDVEHPLASSSSPPLKREGKIAESDLGSGQATPAGRAAPADLPLSGGGKQTPYAFLPVEGENLHRIPVGPVHAGIIEPGHFRFTASGETVVRLEQRLGYVHKGIESLMAGATISRAAQLAARTSGDSTVAYAIAFAQATEAALTIAPPPRAVYLRALMAELERLANHFGDIGAVCNDASFSIMHAHCGILRERVLRAAYTSFGHRLMMDRVIPGGVSHDLPADGAATLHTMLTDIRRRFPKLIELYDNTASLQDRTIGTGMLRPELARQFGAPGYVGRASGRAFDARKTPGYAPYTDLDFVVPVLNDGDVNARVWLRIREVEQSLNLVEQLIARLPEGPLAAALNDTGNAEGLCEGLGLAEGFRGDVLIFVRLEGGRVTRCHLRDPSWFQWPLLEAAIEGNIVADFPLCNKSFNCSYSGHDL